MVGGDRADRRAPSRTDGITWDRAQALTLPGPNAASGTPSPATDRSPRYIGRCEVAERLTSRSSEGGDAETASRRSETCCSPPDVPRRARGTAIVVGACRRGESPSPSTATSPSASAGSSGREHGRLRLKALDGAGSRSLKHPGPTVVALDKFTAETGITVDVQPFSEDPTSTIGDHPVGQPTPTLPMDSTATPNTSPTSSSR
jgi:hypothetical protein